VSTVGASSRMALAAADKIADRVLAHRQIGLPHVGGDEILRSSLLFGKERRVTPPPSDLPISASSESRTRDGLRRSPRWI
jgi:hypothetical protein